MNQYIIKLFDKMNLITKTRNPLLLLEFHINSMFC